MSAHDDLATLRSAILEIDKRVATVGAPMLPHEHVFTGWLAIHGNDWRSLVALAKAGGEPANSAVRDSEVVTEALYNGTAVTLFADEDGVWAEHGQPMADDARRAGPYFDLLAAIAGLVDELGG